MHEGTVLRPNMALGYTAYHTSCCRFTGANISIPDITKLMISTTLDFGRVTSDHYTLKNTAECGRSNQWSIVDRPNPAHTPRSCDRVMAYTHYTLHAISAVQRPGSSVPSCQLFPVLPWHLPSHLGPCCLRAPAGPPAATVPPLDTVRVCHSFHSNISLDLVLPPI